MEVVFVSVNSLENYVGMMLRPRLEEFFEVALNPVVEDLASVFGWPHQVIVTDKNRVAHSPIHGHLYSISESYEEWGLGA